jgi:hypothetical protein
MSFKISACPQIAGHAPVSRFGPKGLLSTANGFWRITPGPEMAVERPSYVGPGRLRRQTREAPPWHVGAGGIPQARASQRRPLERAIIDRRCGRGTCQTLCPQSVDSLNTSAAVVFPRGATDISTQTTMRYGDHGHGRNSSRDRHFGEGGTQP